MPPRHRPTHVVARSISNDPPCKKPSRHGRRWSIASRSTPRTSALFFLFLFFILRETARALPQVRGGQHVSRRRQAGRKGSTREVSPDGARLGLGHVSSPLPVDARALRPTAPAVAQRSGENKGKKIVCEVLYQLSIGRIGAPNVFAPDASVAPRHFLPPFCRRFTCITLFLANGCHGRVWGLDTGHSRGRAPDGHVQA